MKKRFYFILLLMSCSLSLCFMSSTYSRYVAGTTGNIDILFAKWQILLNNNDITEYNNSEMTFTPTIIANDNVASNMVAPTSKGYFDININPKNVDVSFNYKISLDIENEDIPDLLITKYALLPDNYKDGDNLDYVLLTDNIITDELIFDNSVDNFEFDEFTIRIFFEWVDGEDEVMDDSMDTIIGSEATEDIPFNIKANIIFEQIITEVSDDLIFDNNVTDGDVVVNNDIIDQGTDSLDTEDDVINN